MRNKQLSLQFYKDEECHKTPKPKYGDIVVIERTSVEKKQLVKNMVFALILTEKDYLNTSYTWRDKLRNAKGKHIPLVTMETFNSEVKRYNHYLEMNKVKWMKCAKPSTLTKAKKSNTNVGDELVTITKARTTYKLEKTIYDGAMNLKGYFKV